jgi:hypothetical protein
MTGQGERRRRMNIVDVIRIDRDRLAAIEMVEVRIVRARQNRLVEIFKAFGENSTPSIVGLC